MKSETRQVSSKSSKKRSISNFFVMTTTNSSVNGTLWTFGSQEITLHLTVEGKGSGSVRICTIRAKQLVGKNKEEKPMALGDFIHDETKTTATAVGRDLQIELKGNFTNDTSVGTYRLFIFVVLDDGTTLMNDHEVSCANPFTRFYPEDPPNNTAQTD
ncbi:hypothetical protein HD806DRAFT_482941 [Xylariaceae sp. AK1471]|nr:hypothetical protein HD806DRAFT_482941 [Xylariaceae sp. AK1471]